MLSAECVVRLAAMEPGPDGRGKDAAVLSAEPHSASPQWSPGLMAGGSTGDTWKPTALMEPQWSPGLMAGGSSDHNPRDDGEVCAPQWSPGLMAGGRSPATLPALRTSCCRNGAPA